MQDKSVECVLPFGEGHLGGHCNLALAPLDRDHAATQGAGFPVHLDALLKELLLETSHTHKLRTNICLLAGCVNLWKID